MNDYFKAVKITDNLYWVGAIDWNITDFHGYATKRGTTYNAFLIMAENITLIDTVKASFRDEMMARIASVIDPKEISVVISNHSEMDHSGCLPYVVDTVKPDRVYASKMGQKAITGHFHRDCAVTAVADGEVISLGDREIKCYETRMLHWPDSMISYLPDDGILFSQDAFGMHLASNERFADELSANVVEYEAARYFANILMPYSQLITRLLDRIPKLDFDLTMIAPDHGPIYRTEKDIRTIGERYAVWAGQKPALKAVVVYDTMWNSTDMMARSIADGLAYGGVRVKVMSLRAAHRSDVATELLDAGALLVGSPTLNNTIFPTVADVMVYLKGLRPKNLIGAAFGSYGWGGEAVGQLEVLLDEMKVERVAESIRIEYVPEESDLVRCFEFGVSIAEKLKKMC